MNKLDDQRLLVLTSGGFAGLAAKTCVAPLERIKLLNQAGQSHGVVSAFKDVYFQEGVPSFWRGNLTNCMRVFPNKSILFACNDKYKQLYSNFGISPWLGAVMAGASAGATADLATYPLDLSRTRQAAQLGATRYSSLSTTVVLTVKEEGFFALYRGLGITLAACIPYEGIRFGAFHHLTGMQQIPPAPMPGFDPLSIPGLALSGMCAGLVAVLLTYPNDTVRRRMQMQGVDRIPPSYRHSLHCYRDVIAREGTVALYRGMPATLLRAVPNTAIQFVVFEKLRAAWA